MARINPAMVIINSPVMANNHPAEMIKSPVMAKINPETANNHPMKVRTNPATEMIKSPAMARISPAAETTKNLIMAMTRNQTTTKTSQTTEINSPLRRIADKT